jgi:hypothetical protein
VWTGFIWLRIGTNGGFYKRRGIYRLAYESLCSMELVNAEEHTGTFVQKFPDWPPGARTANGTALCHKVQLYRYFVNQSSEFCRHNPLCCFSTSVYCCLFRYRLSPETFGYTLVCTSPQPNLANQTCNLRSGVLPSRVH